MITNIKEKDFRKLNLKVWQFNIDTRTYERVPLNKLLDKEISLCLEGGYEENRTFLENPVTIAIHKDNNKKNWQDGSFYLDKFMDAYSGARTFEIGWDISHLYSSRDYYEDHESYWRVKKTETDVVYRVYLEPRNFVLKHKTEVIEGEYGKEWTEAEYDLDEQTGEWKLQSKVKFIRRGSCVEIKKAEV